MKKAFTLIELLVVIAIIAILAAILFPVFAQAKTAAKKTQGLSQSKQIGTALQIYLNDSDDVLPPYRFTSATQNINPFYLKLRAANDPRAATLESRGGNTIRAVFFNQLLAPYVKNDQIWLSPGNGNGWVNFQDKGSHDPGFHSYGGQNSYGVNNYLLTSVNETSGSPMSSTAVAEQSNTLLMIDATYYNTLPAQPAGSRFCKLNGYDPTNGRATSSYFHYWKHLGNSALNFNALGNSDPDNATNANVIKQIENRYSGTLNMVRVDTSAKAITAREAVYDLRTKGAQSFWNPTKTACE